MKKSPSLSVGLVFDDSLDSSDGVAQYVKTLGAWLSNEGHSVSYFVGETKIQNWHGGKVYSLAKNQTVYFNGNRLSIPVAASNSGIKAALKTAKPDVLHVMVPYSPFMGARVIKQVGARTAVVGTFHIFPAGTMSKFGSRLLHQWLRPTLKRFDALAAVSKVSADFARKFYGIDSQVIPNPVEIDHFKTDFEPARAKKIVFLGRLVKRKGAAELIQAFALLQETMPDSSLVIAGDGPDKRKLKKLVSIGGLEDKVSFLGYIAEDDKPALLATADIACFPSLYGEAFGIVLIEAMSAGSGVILAGDNPGYTSVLGSQPDLLVDPQDTNIFAKRLETLLVDRKKIQELHQWQNRTVKQYDVNVVGNQVLEMYLKARIARRAKTGNN